tara:strand:- start:574 stop:696 length:123 start_codon:yes stop_codon:yes gene_type:complete
MQIKDETTICKACGKAEYQGKSPLAGSQTGSARDAGLFSS